jgi:inhibitor of KinA sporulation pathway (predicted exonuclease)
MSSKHLNKVVINKSISKPHIGGKQVSVKYTKFDSSVSYGNIDVVTVKVSEAKDDDNFIKQFEPLIVPVVEDESAEMVNGYYVVIDFESTCSNSEFPRNEMEIIEFAAVLVRKATLIIEDDFTMFVKPVIHPELTEYCKNLTNITQEDVGSAFSFTTVLKQFSKWMDKFEGPKTFCSWGGYDNKQLQQDCALHDIEFPFDGEHINIKKLFSEVKGYKRSYSLGSALNKLNLEFEGTPHRGIDDARNTAKILSMILE